MKIMYRVDKYVHSDLIYSPIQKVEVIRETPKKVIVKFPISKTYPKGESCWFKDSSSFSFVNTEKEAVEILYNMYQGRPEFLKVIKGKYPQYNNIYKGEE